MTQPEHVVQRQLDAYNARDLAAFVACYAEDVRVIRLPETAPSITGKTALAEHYARNRFSLPGLHAALLGRMVFGNKVIDHELITGIAADPVHAAAVYEVKEGLICNVWFVNPS